MKYFVVIALVGLLLLLLSYRKLRPYLRTLLNFIKAIRQFQAQTATRKNQVEAEKLVRCAGCGVWVPETRALAADRSRELVYCSKECLTGIRKVTSPLD